MGDREFLNESCEEMEDSSKDNDTGEDAFQYNREKSDRNPSKLTNQILAFVQQDGSENQEFPSGKSEETSSVPTSASSSPTPNIHKLDETASSKNVFYSSLKLRIHTKCSRIVDAIISNRQHSQAFKNSLKEFERTPATLEQQDANLTRPARIYVAQGAPKNQKLPSGISTETSSGPSVLTSQVLNIDKPDDTFASKHLFHSSRYFQIRTNYSRWADALLSPGQDPTYSSEPFLEHSDVDSARTIQRNRSSLEESRNTKSASPPQSPPIRVTRSSLKARSRQKMFTPSPKKQIVEKRIGSTSAKKRRIETPENDYGKSKTKQASFRSNLLPSITVRTRSKSPPNVKTQTIPAARESESSASVTKPITPNKRKSEMMESSSSDTETEELPKSNISSPISDVNIDYKSSGKLQADESYVVKRNLGGFSAEGNVSTSLGDVSTSLGDCPTDSGSLEKHSDPDDLYGTKSIVNLSTEEHEAIEHSNISTDADSDSSHKDSSKRRKKSLTPDIWCADFPKKPGSPFKLRRLLADNTSISSLEETLNPQISIVEDCAQFMEVKTEDRSPLSSEETELASNKSYSSNHDAASNLLNLSPENCEPFMEVDTLVSLASPEEAQLDSKVTDSASRTLGSLQSRLIFENPELPTSPSKVHDSGIETSASSSIFANPHFASSCDLPEKSSSSDINVPHQVSELETIEKERTDRNLLDSSARISKPSEKSILESKKHSLIKNLARLQRAFSHEMLKQRDLPEIQDSEEPMQENSSDPPLLNRKDTVPVSSCASTSREISEMEMDLDPPHLDISEGQPSTSSHQPVITTSSFVNDQFNSRGTTLSQGTGDEVIRANPSAERISKYTLNTQELLLIVFEEILNIGKKKDLYQKFSELFRSVNESPNILFEIRLTAELLKYLDTRRKDFNAWAGSFGPDELALEYYVAKAYEALIRIIVKTLISTLSVKSSLNIQSIMCDYKMLKSLYEKYAEFWKHNAADKYDKTSKHRVAFLNKTIQEFLLRTRNAYREFLMHIGEHANQEDIDKFEEDIFEEDKSYLRRQIL